MIGRVMCAETKDGGRYWMKIVDVRIYPAGGHNVKYDFTAKPYKPDGFLSEKSNYSNKGYSLSFDIGVDTKKFRKQIKQLIQ